MKRKILAAVDGSMFSFNALNYLSHLFTDREEINVHLLCVVSEGSSAPGMEWLKEQDKLAATSKQARIKLSAAKRFMEEAVLQLGRRGIAPVQISNCIKLSRFGIAADILTEAQKGLYDALLIGRRGIGKIEELFMGSSLSRAMTRHNCNLPLWIVDGKVKSRKFILPVDRSFNSLKAADHLGFILEDNPNIEISLLHLSCMIGGNTDADMPYLREMWGAKWCDRHLTGSDAIFHGPEQILLDRGIEAAQIKRLDQALCLQPHTYIIQHGNKNDCGTIVIGRRAMERQHGKNGAFKGVSDSVLSLAKHMAVWIVD